MTVIATSSDSLGTIAVAILAISTSLIATEIFSYGTKIGLLLVRLSVKMLPATERPRHLEEWSDHVITRSGQGKHNLSALFWGIGTIVAAGRRSRAIPRLAERVSDIGSRAGRWFSKDEVLPLRAMLAVGLYFGGATGLAVTLEAGFTAGSIAFGSVFLVTGSWSALVVYLPEEIGVFLIIGTILGGFVALAAGIVGGSQAALLTGIACGAVATVLPMIPFLIQRIGGLIYQRG